MKARQSVLLIIVAMVLVGLMFRGNPVNKIVTDTTRIFIERVFAGDAIAAAQMSKGVIKRNLANNDLSEYKSILLTSRVDVEEIRGAVAQTVAVIEFSRNNRLNTIFYRVRLLNLEDKWVIEDLQECDPPLDKKMKTEFVTTEFETVYQTYLDMLQANRYDDAALKLVGRARSMHERAMDPVKEAKLISDIQEFSCKPLVEGKTTAAVTVSYKNQGRRIEAAVWYYRTHEGWKIYKIEQL